MQQQNFYLYRHANYLMMCQLKKGEVTLLCSNGGEATQSPNSAPFPSSFCSCFLRTLSTSYKPDCLLFNKIPKISIEINNCRNLSEKKITLHSLLGIFCTSANSRIHVQLSGRTTIIIKESLSIFMWFHQSHQVMGGCHLSLPAVCLECRTILYKYLCRFPDLTFHMLLHSLC